MRIAKSSTGARIGEVDIEDAKIVIKNDSKPYLEILDGQVIRRVKNRDKTVMGLLFEEYELNIGEIAALFNVPYYLARKELIDMGINTSSRQGRHNSSFSATFPQSRCENISKAKTGKPLVYSYPYERTPEIRHQISETLKAGYQSGDIVVNKEGISKAWADGKYSNSPMGRGIQGYFRSSKTCRPNGDVYFRSLLELSFLIKSEEDKDIFSIINEPVHIKLSENRIYVPDFLINENILIELKPKNHMLWTKDNEKNRFAEEVSAAEQYCADRKLEFRIIYDDDLGFETSAFKRFIRDNPDIVKQYNIRFNDPTKLAGR